MKSAALIYAGWWIIVFGGIVIAAKCMSRHMERERER